MTAQRTAAVRIVLAGLAGVAVLGAGLIGWRAWQRSTVPPPGRVLGQSLPQNNNWAGQQVLLGGPDGTTIQLWSKDEGVRPLQGFEARTIAAAAATTDGSTLLLAEQQGKSALLWMLDATGARIVAALTGSVTSLRISADGRFAGFLWQQPGRTAFDLHAVDTKTGTVQRVADDILGAQWLTRGAGLISVNAAGELHYHALLLTGTFDAPQLLATAIGFPAVIGLDRLLFFRPATADQPAAVVNMDLIRKEQFIVAPIAAPVLAGAQIVPDAAAQRALLFLPSETEEQNASLALLDLANGQMQPLSVAGSRARWLDNSHVLLEQRSATASRLVYVSVDEGTSFSLPGDDQQHLLP